ncbi:hypothetical protein AWB80_04811 [Caballeronia pedi]|uniref:Uncharacterized protein n=1 Tax=Caballeronia pedi TaxID=1777141 RepID=A0A158C8P4_9BURK|nr:hypothetical protein AWB80_04811 [Caballeronia pedi]
MRHAFTENHRLGTVRQILAPELLIALEGAGRAVGVIVIDEIGEPSPAGWRGLASLDQRGIDRREALREKEKRKAIERDVMNPLKQEEPRRAGLKKRAVEEGMAAEIDGFGKRGLHMAIDGLHGVGRIADVDHGQREVYERVRHHLMRHAIVDDDAHLHRVCFAHRLPDRRLQYLDVERPDDLRQLREIEARIAQVELLPKEDARLSGSERKAEHGINPYMRAHGCSGNR